MDMFHLPGIVSVSKTMTKPGDTPMLRRRKGELDIDPDIGVGVARLAVSGVTTGRSSLPARHGRARCQALSCTRGRPASITENSKVANP